MRLEEIFDNQPLSEAAVRAFKRIGDTIQRRYRCMAGPKMGKLVVAPGACGQRKDPKNIRKGRKTMRTKKGIIQRKSRVTKRQAMSRLVRKMNQRLSGKAMS